MKKSPKVVDMFYIKFYLLVSLFLCAYLRIMALGSFIAILFFFECRRMYNVACRSLVQLNFEFRSRTDAEFLLSFYVCTYAMEPLWICSILRQLHIPGTSRHRMEIRKK